MKHFRFLALTIISIFFLTFLSFALEVKNHNSLSLKYDSVPGLVIVKFKNTPKTSALNGVETFSSAGIASIDKKMRQFSITKAEKLFAGIESPVGPGKVDLSRIFRLSYPPTFDPDEVANAFNSDPLVEYAEPVYLAPLDEVPNDPRYPQQEHLPQIFAPQAWDLVKGDSAVIIGIVDSGVDYNHPDLADNIWMNEAEVIDGIDNDGNGYVDDIRGWDWVNGLTEVAPGEDGTMADNDPMDFGGHGTFVSGCATAVTNNGIGIAAIGWNCTIMPLRVGWQPATGNGLVRSDWSAQAFIYAADNGAHVINLSAGNSQVVADAGRYAHEKGVVVATSAGNGNTDTVDDPLNVATFALSVAAVDDRDHKASYSNYGDWIKVSAPGGDQDSGRPGILSTYFDDTYARLQGTSFSSPITAGLACLLKARHPDWRPGDIIIQIVETADNIDALNPGFEGLLGSGRINAYRAVTEQVNAFPKLTITQIIPSDAIGGNGDGSLDAGETIQLNIEFDNIWADVSKVSATLRSEDYAIRINQANAVYTEIPGLSDLENNKTFSSTPFEITVIDAALPHRAKFYLDLASANGYAETFAFNLAISANILLVDDDDNANNIESYYTSVLDSLSLSFDYWNRATQGPVGFTRLMNYPVVIWLCEWTFPSLDADDRSDLEFYLLSGGNLFLSGQDIGWDLNDTGGNNEYERSEGAALDFYENYLRGRYILDDSESNSVTGVPGNPIGAGLGFTIFQPGRAADNQYPSEIQPVNGGQSIFDYANGNSGAVLYRGDYSLVSFAFGGYEAIVEDDIRFEVMNRVMNWFAGIDLQVTELTDTEDTMNDYVVEAMVASANSPLTGVDLYRDTDGVLPFQKIPMTALGSNQFMATIPAQTNAQIQYFVFAQNEAGFYTPVKIHSFYAGVDQKPPVITRATAVPDQLSNNGPFAVNFKARDNIGIDTSYGFVHFYSKNAAETAIAMTFADSGFTGAIPGPFAFADTVHYYFSTRDISTNQNIGQSDVSDFTIGHEGFENGLVNWTGSDSSGWALDAVSRNGNNSLRWNALKHDDAKASIITLKQPLNLTGLTGATLRFWYFHITRPSDYVVIEASGDSGITWNELSSHYSGIKINTPANRYLEEQLALDSFINQEIEKIWLRFNYVIGTGTPAPANGFWVDDMEILPFSTGIEEAGILSPIPESFELMQNFPNPFNMATIIRYKLPQKSQVTIDIYNMLGQQVRRLVHTHKSAGTFSVIWDGLDDAGTPVPSGVYIYKMTAANFEAKNKLLLIK